MKTPNSSIIDKIQDAAATFETATTARFTALGALYGIFVKTENDSSAKSEIELAFQGLPTQERPQKCKSLAGKIAWIAFSHSKQRVSDAKKLMEFAQLESVAPVGFAQWLVENGGIRATLLTLANSSTGEKQKAKPEKLFSTMLNDLWDVADNRRIEHQNPTPRTLNEGEKYVQITELKNGIYTVVDAVVSGLTADFSSNSQPTKPVPSIAEMAQQAKAAKNASVPQLEAA